MARRSAPSGRPTEPAAPKRLRVAALTVVSCAVAAGGYALISRKETASPPGTPAFATTTPIAIEPASTRTGLALLPLSSAGLGWAIDPAPISGRMPKRFAQAKPLSAAWVPARPSAPEKFAAASIPALKPTLQPTPAPSAIEIAKAAAPLPMPRPGDLRGAQNPPATTTISPVAAPAVSTPTAIADASAPKSPRRTSRRSQRMIAAAQPVPADTRNFLEKLFGLPASTGPATTYASLGGTLPAAPTPSWTPVPSPSAGGLTAIYDISARTVTLPSGEVLEAHSGLGAKMDDPRFAHVRMQGVTPPGTYDLTERERLFHGVRAIRMNPVGGSAAIHGRDGILAHTYMLGPSGQSNGCISFRDYNRFLQAFLRGEVRRIVVVPGQRGSALPFFAEGTGRRGSRA